MSRAIKAFIAWLRTKGLLPHHQGFFDLFAKQVRLIRLSSKLLLQLIQNSANIEARRQIYKKITELETEGDKILGEIDTLCNEALIPPFSELIIIDLTQALDDTLDGIEGTAKDFLSYSFALKETTPNEVVELATMIAKAGERLPEIIPALKKFRHAYDCYDIMRDLEHRADDIKENTIPKGYLQVLQSKKDQEPMADLIFAIALDKIISRLEATTDNFQRIAVIVKGVVTKRV